MLGSLTATAQTISDAGMRLEDLLDPRLAESGFSVDEVVVRGDQLTATLRGGTLVDVISAGGDRIGALYLGEGHLVYEPLDEVERYQLQRKTGHDRLDGPLEHAFFLTDDATTLAALAPAGAVEVEVPARARAIFHVRWQEYADPKWGDGPNLEVLRIQRELDGAQGEGFSYAEFGFAGLEPYRDAQVTRPFDWASYLSMPDGALATGRRSALFGHSKSTFGHLVEVFCGGAPVASGRPIDVVSTDMDLTIPAGGPAGLSRIENTVSIQLTATGEPVSSVSLDLLTRTYSWYKDRYVELRIEEIVDYTGEPLPHVHHRGKLLVPLRAPLNNGEAETLTIRYSGEALFALDQDSYWVLNTWPWYPMNGFIDRGKFAVTVHYPAHLRMAGTGTTTSVEEADGVRTERWEEPVPVHFPSMIIGNFTTVEEAETPSGVKVRAFFTPAESQHASEAVGEGLRVVQYYEDLYGPFPFAELDIAEMAVNMGFWQAPPGLVLITKYEIAVEWIDSPTRGRPHYASSVLSHEIAHQYWGHVVGWASPDDQWLSEALAEYSSHLYISHYYGPEDYAARLDMWRKGAREDSRFGAVALAGRRLGRGRYPLWYHKGPYVLHMLRGWVGDKEFVDLLATTCQVAAHRNLATTDLQAISEKRLGTDMAWFFDPWLRTPHLPKIEATYTLGDGNRPPIHLAVRQVHQGPPMKLRIPVRITVQRGRKTREIWRTVTVDQDEMTVDIKGVNGEVTRVDLDPEATSLWGRDPVQAVRDE